MIDVRGYEKEANRLLKKNRTMKFRLILPNGNLVERQISPIIVGSVVKCYRDQKFLYKSLLGEITDIYNVSIKTLRLLQHIENPSIKTDGFPVKHTIVELLKMHYKIIE